MKTKIVDFLRWSERFMETDMVYAAKGGFWIVFGRAGMFAIAFVKMIVFGRFFSQEAYGVYAFVLSMAVILGIFSLPGVNISLIKAIARGKEGTLDLAVKEKMKFSLLGSLASLIASAWYFYNQNYFLASAFLIVGILLPAQSVFTVFSSFWMGRKNFARNSKYELLSAFLVALVTIPVIVLTDNPILVITALFISQALFNGVLLLKTLKQKKNKDVFLESIGFGKSLTIMNAMTMFVGQIDKIILWKFFGPVPLAIYSFAQLPIQKIESVIPIDSLALPKIGEKDISEIKEGIFKKFKKLFFIFVPLVFLVIVFAPLFYRIALPQYVDSVLYFQAFALLLLFAPFSLFNASLVSEMKKKELYTINVAAPVLRMFLFLILIPFFQIWGIVMAIIISQLFLSILTLYFFKKL